MAEERPRRRGIALIPSGTNGTARVTCGEIRFAITPVAERKGIFSSSGAGEAQLGSSGIFLVAIWAKILCSASGSVAVGILIKEVTRLQSSEHH